MPTRDPPHPDSRPRPHLLLDVLVLGVEQFDEDGDSPCLYNYFGMKKCPGSNVGQGPGSLKL